MNLSQFVERFKGLKILVAGDAMIDQYHFGRVDRISPEAPVPIFLEDYSRAESRRGGADNVAHQLEEWGCLVTTRFASRHSVKHRYFAGHHQVFRRDSDSSERGKVIEYGYINYVDALVLSDYSKGFLTYELCQSLIKQMTTIHNVKAVVVDPKGLDWSKYMGATVVCPNEKEWCWPRIANPWPHGDVVLKQGEKGMTVMEQVSGLASPRQTHIPAQARQVFDVTGAGDIVVAAIAAGLASGATLVEAAHIASCAAGIAVGKLGTAICTKEELLCALASPTGSLTSSTPDTRTSSNGVEISATTSSSPLTQTEASGG